MSLLGKRIARLEGPKSKEFLPIAVCSAPLPAAVSDEWASCLMASYGWSGQRLFVTVKDGQTELLLEPMSLPPVGSEAGALWLRVNTHYPHAVICGSLVWKFDCEADFKRMMASAEKECAA